MNTKVVVLEKSIVDRIDNLGLSKTKKKHAYNLLYMLSEDQKLRRLPIEDQYKDLSKKYMRKVFGGRYLEWFKELIKEDILQVRTNKGREYWQGQAKSYRLNPELRKGELVSLEIEEKPLHIVATFLTSNLTDQEITSDFESLHIDEDKLRQRMWTYITSIDRRSFIIDHEITDLTIEVHDRKYKDKYWTTRDRAITTAAKRGANLIKDRGKFYIDQIDNYILQKRESIRVSYERMIFKLVNRLYYAHRNSTNRRLDTNYTNISKILLDVIIEDNNLVELDVANCQFALLSKLYKEHRGTSNPSFRFYDYYARKGLIYEIIHHNLKLSNRNEAKSMMFEVCFSSRRYRSDNKEALNRFFPEIMEFVDWYKMTFGDNQLPIDLQLEESQVFIDEALNQVKLNGLFCISRHDSFLVKSDDAFSVYSIIRKVFNDSGFPYCTINVDWDKEDWIYEYSFDYAA